MRRKQAVPILETEQMMSRGGENFALPKRNSFLYYSQTFPFPVVLTTRHQQATVGSSRAAAFPFKKFRIGYCQPPILPPPILCQRKIGNYQIYFQSFNPWQFHLGNSVRGIHRNQVQVSDELKFEVA